MKIRKIKRRVWFACSGALSKVDYRMRIYAAFAEVCSRRQRRALIAGNKARAVLQSELASRAERKAEHYRRFLRMH